MEKEYLDRFIEAAKKQEYALEQGGWGHAIWCNYQRPECRKCNCGIADIQSILKDYEKDLKENKI